MTGRGRWLRAALVLRLIAAAVVAALWAGSYVADLHIGKREYRDILPHVPSERRAGLFSARGRLIWAAGTELQFQVNDRSRAPYWVIDQGVYAGRFDAWTGAGRTGARLVLGFGNGREAVAGDPIGWRMVCMPHAFAALLLLLGPIVRLVGRRLGVADFSLRAGTVALEILLLVVGLIAMAEPPLGALLMLYLGAVAGLVGVRQALVAVRQARALARLGRCRVCGYDLRATPDADGRIVERCPECGTFSRPL